MTRTERNRCVHWRLGWLPGGKLVPCPRHPIQLLTKQHAIKYLAMYNRLQMPETVQDPLLFFSTYYQIEYHVHLTLPLHGLLDGLLSAIYFMNLTTRSMIRTSLHCHSNRGKYFPIEYPLPLTSNTHLFPFFFPLIPKGAFGFHSFFIDLARAKTM